MGNMLSSLLATAGAIKAYDRALDVIQNNVSNASTPGYVAARLNLVAQPFDPTAGRTGGVRTGTLETARDDFVERSVWKQQNDAGQYTQRSESVAPIEQILGVTAEAALPSDLNQMFQSFSQLATAPNDPVQRRQVLDNAGQLASSINAASSSLTDASNQTDQLIRNTVDQINQIVGQVRDYNVAVSSGAVSHQDAGADAAAYAALENLSQLVDFTAQRDANGEFDIRLGSGQSNLLLGNQQDLIQVDFSHAQTGILNSNGEAAASQVNSGKLAALLDVKNNLLPSYSSGLDRLAAGLADQVNGMLNNGLDRNGDPGEDIFSYDAAQPAATLTVIMTDPDKLAAATEDAAGGNGNATRLAALANQAVLDGATFSQFYGTLAAKVGREKASSDRNQQLHEELLSQAQGVREQTSAVSLDEEATRLMQFQRAYQASAQLLTVLSQLTGTIINMLQA
jgi:flagellar hook-associated protein 1 FlgK